MEDLSLKDEGILVLCIENENGEVKCPPTGDEQLSAGDELTVFAKEDSVNELKSRLNDETGKQAHQDAKQKYQKEMRSV